MTRAELLADAVRALADDDSEVESLAIYLDRYDDGTLARIAMGSAFTADIYCHYHGEPQCDICGRHDASVSNVVSAVGDTAVCDSCRTPSAAAWPVVGTDWRQEAPRR